MIEGQWCILRTSGAATLLVADSLAEAGFQAWTPREQIRQRIQGVRNRKRDIVAVTPSFVFAGGRHVGELLALSQSPANPHPGFTVFRARDGVPLIADIELEPLRAFERGQERKWLLGQKAPRLDVGTLVRCAEAGLEGLTGKVEESRGKYTLVAFPGLTMRIATMLLVTTTPGAKAA